MEINKHIGGEETSSIVSGDMEWDSSQRPTKRKLEQPNDTSQEDSEVDIMERPKVKVSNRRRVKDDEEKSTRRLRVTRPRRCSSDPDTHKNEDEEVIAERKEKAERKIMIGKIEIGKKVGRPKKNIKAIDLLVAEQSIFSQMENAPDSMDMELLNIMTVSDISAQALDYIKDIELIRTKCGRMQGGLSGELKKRVNCLGDLVRSLQEKAETKEDPQFLRCKITELLNEIKRNKKEEERKEREMSELKNIIKDLKQENKAMREEIRKIRDSLERKDSKKEKYSPAYSTVAAATTSSSCKKEEAYNQEETMDTNIYEMPQ